MDSMTQKFAAVISPLIVIQKAKFWNGLKRKPKNVSESHGQTFGTPAKPNIPVRSAKDGLTLSFYVTQMIGPTSKGLHTETRDWKLHMFSWPT
jgi:hypothetical protein